MKVKEYYEQENEVRENYKAFIKLLPELLKSDPGKWCFLQDKKLVSIHENSDDAMNAAKATGKPFSVQEITDKVIDLGYWSRVTGV